MLNSYESWQEGKLYLNEVIVRVQHESIKFDIDEHKEYTGRFCESDNTLGNSWETHSIKQEKIEALLRVFQKDKISTTSFSSTEVSYLFQTIQKIIDKLKICLRINELVISANLYFVDVEKYEVLKNFLINKLNEFKIVFYYPFDMLLEYSDSFHYDKQQINIMNTCSEVIFPNTETDIGYNDYGFRREYFLLRKTCFCLCSCKALELILKCYDYSYHSQEYCSFILKIVTTGLVKKLSSFEIEYSLNTEAELYVMNKLLWNAGTNFEDVGYWGNCFEKNNKLKKYFLWLLNKKKKHQLVFYLPFNFDCKRTLLSYPFQNSTTHLLILNFQKLRNKNYINLFSLS
eukprot:snap_masked-scaffold_17-processed-gene-2.22-mRNA-1 protein AED:1.00 eAED:1.00 QI:0/0/0/0/1/1/3/0/344